MVGPHQLPTRAHVIARICESYPLVCDLTIEPFTGSQRGIYRVYSASQTLDLEELSLTIEGKETNVPYESFRPFRKKQGTLITMLQCKDGQFENISNEVFDKVIQEHGTLLKLTEWQKHRESPAFNGNRYCVIEPRGTIPEKIQIPNQEGKLLEVNLNFKGKAWFCGRCGAKHTTACPQKEAFLKQKALREALEVDTIVVADSTLRKADEVGLNTDVVSIPGAKLGHLTNYIDKAPYISREKYNQVVISAGTNNILDDTQTLEEHNASLEWEANKLKMVIDKTGIDMFVLTPCLPEEPLTPLQNEKLIYFRKTICSMQRKKILQYVHIENKNEIEFQDERGKLIHPSQKGTLALLQKMDKSLPFDLIREEEFSTVDKPYLGCQWYYKHGCVLCQSNLLECKEHRPLNQEPQHMLRSLSDSSTASETEQETFPKLHCETPQEVIVESTNSNSSGSDLETTPKKSCLGVKGHTPAGKQKKSKNKNNKNKSKW